MKIKKIIWVGTIAGLVMGVTLFIGGAILARVVYGPQMAPAGKFDADQMNPVYFIWTKLLIGIVFGNLFLFVYEKLPLVRRIKGPLQGMKFSFFFWLVLSLWNLSHPITYESINYPNQIFWLLYTLCGFLSFGCIVGLFYKRYEKKKIAEESI